MGRKNRLRPPKKGFTDGYIDIFKWRPGPIKRFLMAKGRMTLCRRRKVARGNWDIYTYHRDSPEISTAIPACFQGLSFTAALQTPYRNTNSR